MGDRSVIGIKTESTAPTLYLYSHWGGGSRYEDLLRALDAAWVRLGDDSYFTRIFISQLVGDDWSGELGYGLSVDSFTCPDYDDVPVVNLAARTLDFYAGTAHDELRLAGRVDLAELRSYPDAENLQFLATQLIGDLTR